MQEEILLSLAVAAAICVLLLNLNEEAPQDYAFACFFLICAVLLLRIRWFVGIAVLTLPIIVVSASPLWGSSLLQVLPQDAALHINIAWAIGGLISFMADFQRRCVLPI